MAEESAPETYRLFIAITVPETVKGEVDRAQAGLRRALPEKAIRWTPREQFHLTLRFLGNVESQRTGELSQALGDVCSGFAPIRLRAAGIGFFPNARRPRVLWVGLDEPSGELKKLQQAIQSAVQGFTLEEPEKRFVGHVTLGRVKELRRSEADALAKAAFGMEERVFGEWTTTEVEIMRSQLSPKGARHTVLASARLGMDK